MQITTIKVSKSIIPAYTRPKPSKHMSSSDMETYWKKDGTFNDELYKYICKSRKKQHLKHVLKVKQDQDLYDFDSILLILQNINLITIIR